LNRPVPASRRSKDALFDGLAEVGRALASGPRLALMDLLSQGERSVDELASAAGLSVANASRHLQILRRAGLVSTRREGSRVHYRPAGDDVVALWLSLRAVAAGRVGEVERAARDYLGDEVEAVGRDELVARLGSGDLVVVDVRPRLEFAAGHIQGARSVPLDELEARLAELPADAEVVAYCRGPYCVYADDAVRELRRRGFSARRLIDGYPEWKRAGLPVAVGT
jgi:rhodanese-related sulfurtransferase/DNA-binding MarR family transcriptional regulator